LSNELPWQIQNTGIKTVVTIHDLIFIRYPELYPTIDRWIYKQKFKSACEKADCVVAISQQTKNDIVDMLHINPSKIEVVYQDCDIAFRNQLSTEQLSAVSQKYHLDKPYILCVATIADRKNQLTLVKAFEELQNRMWIWYLLEEKVPIKIRSKTISNKNISRSSYHQWRTFRRFTCFIPKCYFNCLPIHL
jgi:glycosyltransferase involved in cell wall biosynthesis